jgi:hypothetical protein
MHGRLKEEMRPNLCPTGETAYHRNVFEPEIVDISEAIPRLHFSHYNNVFDPDSKFTVHIISWFW